MLHMYVFSHIHMQKAKDVSFLFREMDEETDNTIVRTTQSTCKVDGQTHVTHVHKFFWYRCILIIQIKLLSGLPVIWYRKGHRHSVFYELYRIYVTRSLIPIIIDYT